jgi:aminoglycoside phosphotransferase (APT) family kinase protein
MEPAAARLERLAGRYVPGSGPLQIDRLGSGLVNRSYRVRRDGQLFSFRIAAPRASELGLDREWECRVLHCAADAGLAPAVECCEPRSGILVMRWAPGKFWSVEQASSPGNLAKVALLARRVHALPLLERPRIVSPAQWVAFYRRALSRQGGGEHTGRRDRRRAALDAMAQSLIDTPGVEPAAVTLCHSDLHVHNLLLVPDGTPGGAPIALDWEYAHVSDPWWDLAGWACNGDLKAERRDLLLRLYLDREPTPEEGARLRRLTWLYDYVSLLWSELYLSSRSKAAGAGDTVSARAERLADRLTLARRSGAHTSISG